MKIYFYFLYIFIVSRIHKQKRSKQHVLTLQFIFYYFAIERGKKEENNYTVNQLKMFQNFLSIYRCFSTLHSLIPADMLFSFLCAPPRSEIAYLPQAADEKKFQNRKVERKQQKNGGENVGKTIFPNESEIPCEAVLSSLLLACSRGQIESRIHEKLFCLIFFSFPLM